MDLYELEPEFFKIVDERTHRPVKDIKEADGLTLLCPLCYKNNGNSNIGTHSIMVYQPHVSQAHAPTGGRWKFVGTGLNDLSLVAGSSSILLNGGCRAHFFIRNGVIAWE